MAVIFHGLIPGVTRAVGYLPGALRLGEVQRRDVLRSEVGPTGHFGFFRDRFRHSLWEDAARFLAASHGIEA